jgi:hypothetical protein
MKQQRQQHLKWPLFCCTCPPPPLQVLENLQIAAKLRMPYTAATPLEKDQDNGAGTSSRLCGYTAAKNREARWERKRQLRTTVDEVMAIMALHKVAHQVSAKILLLLLLPHAVQGKRARIYCTAFICIIDTTTLTSTTVAASAAPFSSVVLMEE